jgi:hypothetical protein
MLGLIHIERSSNAAPGLWALLAASGNVEGDYFGAGVLRKIRRRSNGWV